MDGADRHSSARAARRAAAAALLAALALSPALSSRLEPNRYEGGRSRSERALAERNSSSVAIMLGELRSNLSDLMFIKTERYLDSGIGYNEHINMKEFASSGEMPQAGAEPGKGEAVATIIRDRANDFRSFIGDLERKVKPWMDPGKHPKHTDGAELLPWYRLMTLSDPHNTRAYRIGAWWLKDKGGAQIQEALKFLNEGIENNPEAFELYYMRGILEIRSLGDEAKALDSYMAAAELALKARPPQGPGKDLAWTDYQEEDARASVRNAVFLMRKLGRREEALALARRGLAVFAEDKVLDRQVKGMLGNEAPAAPPELMGPKDEHEDEGGK